MSALLSQTLNLGSGKSSIVSDCPRTSSHYNPEKADGVREGEKQVIAGFAVHANFDGRSNMRLFASILRVFICAARSTRATK